MDLTPPSMSFMKSRKQRQQIQSLTITSPQELVGNIVDPWFGCSDRLPERLPQRQVSLRGGMGDIHVGGACCTISLHYIKINMRTVYQLRHGLGQHQHRGTRRCCGGEECLPWLWRSSPARTRLAGKFDAPAWLHGSPAA
jgi:hypothetical protein